MKNSILRNRSIFILCVLILLSIIQIRSGKYTYIVNILFFILLFLIYRVHLTRLTFYYFVLFGLLIMRGIFLGNDLASMSEDVLAFSPLILLFFGKKSHLYELHKNLPFFLVNSLKFTIPIGIVIFYFMDYKVGGLATKRFVYDESTNLHLFAPILPILYSPTLIFYFDFFNRKQKILTLAASFLILCMGVITLTKSVIVFPVIPFILFYSYKLIRNNTNLIKGSFLFILLGFMIWNSGIYEKITTINAVADTIERGNMKSNENDFSSGRIDEALSLLEQNLSLSEYIFGRGMGGHKVRNPSDEFIGGINMMHIGPFHAFLKGGILLVIILYYPILFGIFKFWNTPFYYVSLILLCFFLWNIQTSNWSWGIGMLFYWYSISIYFLKNINTIET